MGQRTTETISRWRGQWKPARCRPLLVGEHAHVLEADHHVASGLFRDCIEEERWRVKEPMRRWRGRGRAVARTQRSRLAREEGEPGGRGFGLKINQAGGPVVGTVLRHGRTESVGSFPFPMREEATQQGVEGLQRTFPGNPDLGSRARARPDPRRHEAAHSHLARAASETDAATVSAAVVSAEMLLASELSNDGLFIVLLRAVCLRKSFSWRMSLETWASSSSPSSSKALKRSPSGRHKTVGRRGASSQVCATEDWCSAECVRMVSVKHSLRWLCHRTA